MKIHGKTLIVDIDTIQPNQYNPKPDYSSTPKLLEEFNKIVKSLENGGQVAPIIVRELSDNSYEIIDGFHRYEAAKKIGATQIEIKNLGQKTLNEAIALTLTIEDTGIQIDSLERAQLIKGLYEDGFDMTLVPYSEEDIERDLALLEFDMEQFSNENEEDGDLPVIEPVEEEFTLEINCTDQLQLEDIENSIITLMKKMQINDKAQLLQIVLYNVANEDGK